MEVGGDREKSFFKHLTIDQKTDKIEGCLRNGMQRCLKIEVEIKVMCEAKSICPVFIRDLDKTLNLIIICDSGRRPLEDVSDEGAAFGEQSSFFSIGEFDPGSG